MRSLLLLLCLFVPPLSPGAVWSDTDSSNLQDISWTADAIADDIDDIRLDVQSIRATELNQIRSYLSNLNAVLNNDFIATIDSIQSTMPTKANQQNIRTNVGSLLTSTRTIASSLGSSLGAGDNVLSYLVELRDLLATNNVLLAGITNASPATSTNILDTFALTNFVANYIFRDDWETMLGQSAPANAGQDSIWETLSLLGNSLNAYYNQSAPFASMKMFPEWTFSVVGDGGYVTPSMMYGSGSGLWPEMQQAQFHFAVSNSSLFAGSDPRRPLPTGAERRQWVNMWGDYNFFTGNPLSGGSLRTTNKEYLFTDWLADFLKMAAATNTVRDATVQRYYEAMSEAATNILDNVSTNGFGEPVDTVTNDWEEVQPWQPPTSWTIPEWSSGSIQSKFQTFDSSMSDWVRNSFTLNVSSNDAAGANLLWIPAMTRWNIGERIFNFRSSLPQFTGVLHTILGVLWAFMGAITGIHILLHEFKELAKAC